MISIIFLRWTGESSIQNKKLSLHVSNCLSSELLIAINRFCKTFDLGGLKLCWFHVLGFMQSFMVEIAYLIVRVYFWLKVLVCKCIVLTCILRLYEMILICPCGDFPQFDQWIGGLYIYKVLWCSWISFASLWTQTLTWTHLFPCTI